MKKSCLVKILFMLSAGFIFSQEVILAKKEFLASVPVSSDKAEEGKLYYVKGFDYFCFPLGPGIGKDGTMYIFNQNCQYDDFQHNIKIKEGKISNFNLDKNDCKYLISPPRKALHSENGFIGNLLSITEEDNGKYSYFLPDNECKVNNYNNITYYPLSNGTLVYDWENKKYFAAVFDENSKKNDPIIFEENELEDFLASGPDRNLYKFSNGKLETFVKKEFYTGKDYCSTLLSGHILICLDHYNLYNFTERQYAVATPDGQIECYIDFPWHFDNSKNSSSVHLTSNGGNYGEIYAVIPPAPELRKFYYSEGPKMEDTIIKGDAEIVVIRNHLKRFGILNDDNVHLRKGPSKETKSLGKFNKGTGFFILGELDEEEVIAGDKGHWIKVRLLDHKEGYVFSAFVRL